jgi:hypothetical protein
MAKPNAKVLVKNAARYLREHPEEIVRAVKGIAGLRVGVPLDALRYLAGEMGANKRAPQDVVLEAAPPGLRVAMTVRAMGSTLRVKLTLYVEEIDLSGDQARLTARIADLTLAVLDGEDTPVAGLIKSGALDLSKPGNLAAFMPKRPDVLVDAHDDRIVLDLMKVPALAKNGKIKRMLGRVTPVLTVAAIRTRDDHLDVHLKASPGNIGQALAT